MQAAAREARICSGRRLRRVAVGVAALLLLAAEAVSAGALVRRQAMNLTSRSFQDGQIPAKYTCKGAGVSPQLAWTAPPAGTASFALIVTDPDAPRGTFTHWVLYDLPAGMRALAEGLPNQGQLADGARQGRNDFGSPGYGGPCPPGHAPHHYVFTLYALNVKLNLPAGATRAQLEAAMQGHILARAELIGLYKQ
jgi:Raf kinase inhibitor-like YbhB/YbcL family protein